ncbi:MAG: hypothetical protein WCO84_02960 [bacterium]
MKKEFDKWNKKKIEIHDMDSEKLYHAIEGKEASAIISQMRVIDIKRFANKISFIDMEIFERIRKAVKDIL